MRRKKVTVLDTMKMLDQCVEQIKELSRGEACDHSVGICWCGTFRVIEDAEEMSQHIKEDVGYNEEGK